MKGIVLDYAKSAVSAVLFVLVLSSIVPFLVSDDSSASGSGWLVSECNGMSVRYTDGDTVLYVSLFDNPGGVSDITVSIDGKNLKGQGQEFGVNMGVALDRSKPYLVVATGSGINASCKLAYGIIYDVNAFSSPQNGGTVTGAGCEIVIK